MFDSSNFQRIVSVSNTHVGKEFELLVFDYFKQQGFDDIKFNCDLQVGLT
jgi:hypothetical protein